MILYSDRSVKCRNGAFGIMNGGMRRGVFRPADSVPPEAVKLSTRVEAILGEYSKYVGRVLGKKMIERGEEKKEAEYILKQCEQ